MSPAGLTRHIPELDGLRGLAILLVVFYHYVAGGFDPADHGLAARLVHSALALSWSGVDLFFVLSGFLIGGILMEYRGTGNYFRLFYLRRSCRILPLYFIWLALFLIVPQWLPATGSDWQEIVFRRRIPALPDWGYGLFLQNIYTAKTTLFGCSWLAVTWSLAVEEQFYLLLPLLIWLVPPRKLGAVLAGLILLVPVFRVTMFMVEPSVFQYVLLPSRADALLLGVLCACLLRGEAGGAWLPTSRRPLYGAVAVILAGMVGLMIWIARHDSANIFGSFEMISLGYSWIAMFYAGLLLMVVTGHNRLVPMMRLPFLRYMGTIAYGVFLMHLAVNDLAHGLILGRPAVCHSLADVAVTAGAFLATLGLATLSWRFLEKPIIGWGHRFAYHKTARYQ